MFCLAHMQLKYNCVKVTVESLWIEEALMVAPMLSFHLVLTVTHCCSTTT